jgi:CspA family cold shock protein
MPKGIVKFFNTEKKFGFIKSDECKDDIFVHEIEVEKPPLLDDQHVEFDVVYGVHGPRAKNVKVIQEIEMEIEDVN